MYLVYYCVFLEFLVLLLGVDILVTDLKRMFLYVIESLDELEELTLKLFSEVKNKNVTVPIWTEHPFGPDQVKVKGFIVPVKDLRNLNITFPIPDLHEYYKAGVSSKHLKIIKVISVMDVKFMTQVMYYI